MKEELVALSKSEHARKIFQKINEKEGIHYNELSRELKFPRMTLTKYLYLMEKANILESRPEKIKILEEYNLKGMPVTRARGQMVVAWYIKKTKEAKEFFSLSSL